MSSGMEIDPMLLPGDSLQYDSKVDSFPLPFPPLSAFPTWYPKVLQIFPTLTQSDVKLMWMAAVLKQFHQVTEDRVGRELRRLIQAERQRNSIRYQPELNRSASVFPPLCAFPSWAPKVLQISPTLTQADLKQKWMSLVKDNFAAVTEARLGRILRLIRAN